MSDLLTDLYRAKNEADSLLKLVRQIKHQIPGKYRQRAWQLQIVHELATMRDRINRVLKYEQDVASDDEKA